MSFWLGVTVGTFLGFTVGAFAMALFFWWADRK